MLPAAPPALALGACSNEETFSPRCVRSPLLVNGNGLNANTNLRNLGLFLEKYLVLLSSA